MLRMQEERQNQAALRTKAVLNRALPGVELESTCLSIQAANHFQSFLLGVSAHLHCTQVDNTGGRVISKPSGRRC